MKRAGFTMIELIFVIVILGILSAVALPKFIGVSDQARAGKCQAFVGTLNRTTLPAIWSDAVLNRPSGTTVAAAFTDANITAQIAYPTDCNLSSTNLATLLQGAAGANAISAAFGTSANYKMELNTTASTSSSPILTWTKQ